MSNTLFFLIESPNIFFGQRKCLAIEGQTLYFILLTQVDLESKEGH